MVAQPESQANFTKPRWTHFIIYKCTKSDMKHVFQGSEFIIGTFGTGAMYWSQAENEPDDAQIVNRPPSSRPKIKIMRYYLACLPVILSFCSVLYLYSNYLLCGIHSFNNKWCCINHIQLLMRFKILESWCGCSWWL